MWHWVAHPLQISLADNSMITTGKQVTLPLVINTEQQQVSFAVINQLNYPSVLGMYWLQNSNPNIDWQTRHISFPSGTSV